MHRSLQNLIGEADQAFRDGLVQRQYNEPEDAAELRFNKLLAALIVAKIEDLYDGASSNEVNLRRITSGLQFSIDDLGIVVQHLQHLRLE